MTEASARPRQQVPSTLVDVLPRAARAWGDKPALVTGGRTFSFVELDQLSSRLASGLGGLGVGVGDRVTLYAQNSWEWVVSYYAVLKLGAVVNPINVMLTPEEVKFVVGDCGARVLLASRDRGEPLLDLQAQTPLKEIVLFGDEVPAGARSFEALIRQGSPDLALPAVAPESLSTICYTSGTTGHPKGAMLAHRSVVLNTAMTAAMHMRTARDTVVTALPCAHVYGNVVMNGCFFFGMTLVLIPRFNEREVLDAVQTHRATMLEGVPSMFMMLLAHPELERHDLSSLTRCTVGGQTMPVAKMQEVEARFGCPLIELWGMTEIAGLGTTTPLYGENRHGSIGVPLPYTACRIADVEDAARTVDRDVVGELMVRGPIVMQGYYGNDAATRETIEPDGWLHSGDLARMDADGYIWIVDRKKDMILTGGYNVYPAEIERVIAAHPTVAMVAVGGLPDEIRGEIAKAYIVLKPGAVADEASIMALCRQQLAAYKLPRRIQFVPDLPKTSTGKIMRRELKSLER